MLIDHVETIPTDCQFNLNTFDSNFYKLNTYIIARYNKHLLLYITARQHKMRLTETLAYKIHLQYLDGKYK